MPDLGSLNQTPQKLGFGTLHMEVYEIPPELAAKYIPPNRLGQGCGPWVQVLGQDPVVGQGAYLKSLRLARLSRASPSQLAPST